MGKSVFLYFNSELFDVFIHIGIVAFSLIGIFLYFYVKAITHTIQESRLKWFHHVIGFVPIIIILSFIFPYSSNIGLWRTYFMNIVYLQWLVYIVLSGKILLPKLRKIIKRDKSLKKIDSWAINVLLGNVFMWLAYFLASYTSYITGAISFSLLTYLLVLLFVFNRKNKAILYRNSHRNIGDTGTDPERILKELEAIMKEQELYRNPNLKSLDVANALNISVHQLSQLINDCLGKNFSNFVNEHRVELAKKMIVLNRKYTIESIGQDCGFNSKASFYAAFKKFTGGTPSKFV